MSICPHVPDRSTTGRILVKFDIGDFTEIYREIVNVVQIGHKFEMLCVKS
jgi:hypothetical protein